jgi:hypothetical protein
MDREAVGACGRTARFSTMSGARCHDASQIEWTLANGLTLAAVPDQNGRGHRRALIEKDSYDGSCLSYERFSFTPIGAHMNPG